MTFVCPRPERPAILRRVREVHSRLELSHLSEARSQRPRTDEGRLWPFVEGESCTRLVVLMACRDSLRSPVDFLNLAVSLSLGGARACKRRPMHRRAADMSGLAHLRKTPTHRTSRSRAAGDMAFWRRNLRNYRSMVDRRCQAVAQLRRCYCCRIFRCRCCEVHVGQDDFECVVRGHDLRLRGSTRVSSHDYSHPSNHFIIMMVRMVRIKSNRGSDCAKAGSSKRCHGFAALTGANSKPIAVRKSGMPLGSRSASARSPRLVKTVSSI